MTILSRFNPHEMSEATVRAVATGRETALAQIVDAVRGNLSAPTMQHLLVTAPRGYGKSFLMRHAQLEIERIARDENLKIVVALMPEEMPHVREPETLLNELTRVLGGGASAEAQLTWHEDDGEAFDAARDALDSAIAARIAPDGLFVAIVENFDMLLREAARQPQQLSRLRAWLTARGSRMMLIAASAGGAVDRDYDSRMFRAFHEIALEPWTIDECLAFFDRQRAEAGRPPLDPAQRARARAVAEFIGGTPRLAVVLGDALLDDDVLGTADLLARLIDDLSAYYKARVETLPGRSQKLLDALLRGGEPATQTELARRVGARNASQALIAAPFDTLKREQIVVGRKASGSADVLYRVADRVFAAYYRRRIIAHGEAPCPLESIVDLLAAFFSPDEKLAKAGEFAARGLLAEARVMARLSDRERGETKVERRRILLSFRRRPVPRSLMDYVRDGAAETLSEVARLALDERIDAARECLDAFLAAAPDEDRVVGLLGLLALDAYEGFDGGVSAAESAIAASRSIANPIFRLRAELAKSKALNYARRNSAALAAAEGVAGEAQRLKIPNIEAHALVYVASIMTDLSRYGEAYQTASQAFALARQLADADRQTESLRIASIALDALGRLEEAVETVERAAQCAQNADDKFAEASALFLAANYLYKLTKYDEAIEKAKAAAAILENAEPHRGLALMFILLGKAHMFSGRHSDSLIQFRRARSLAAQLGDLDLEARSNQYIALSFGELGQWENAVESAHRAVDLARAANLTKDQLSYLRLFGLYSATAGLHINAITHLIEACNIAGDESIYFDKAALIGDARNIGKLAGLGTAPRYSSAPSATILIASAADRFSKRGKLDQTLAAWIESFIDGVMVGNIDAGALSTIAEAIALHFGERFSRERQRLEGAAEYLRSGRSPAALERLDPDFARTLTLIHPPAAPPEAKGPTKRTRGDPANKPPRTRPARKR